MENFAERRKGSTEKITSIWRIQSAKTCSGRRVALCVARSTRVFSAALGVVFLAYRAQSPIQPNEADPNCQNYVKLGHDIRMSDLFVYPLFLFHLIDSLLLHSFAPFVFVFNFYFASLANDLANVLYQRFRFVKTNKFLRKNVN